MTVKLLYTVQLLMLRNWTFSAVLQIYENVEKVLDDVVPTLVILERTRERTD